MAHNRRGDKYSRTRGKLDDSLDVKENEMPPALWIIGPSRSDRAPSSGCIGEVQMVVADGIWAKIDGDGGENAVSEIPALGDSTVVLAQEAEVLAVALVKFGAVI